MFFLTKQKKAKSHFDFHYATCMLVSDLVKNMIIMIEDNGCWMDGSTKQKKINKKSKQTTTKKNETGELNLKFITNSKRHKIDFFAWFVAGCCNISCPDRHSWPSTEICSDERKKA